MLKRSIDFLQVPHFKQGDKIIIYNQQYRNVFATIKEADDVNKIAMVITSEGETHRVDYQDMKEYKDVQDFSSIMNQSVETEEGYRPVGRGNGKQRDTLNMVGSAMQRLEKELYAMKVPVVAIKYESVNTDKWNNGLNTIWQGNVNFNIEFLDINGQKHSATVKVPVENGLAQKAEYVYDNLNRKFNLTADGIQDMLKNINPIDESSDAAVFDVPGTEKTTAETKDKIQQQASMTIEKFTDWLEMADFSYPMQFIKSEQLKTLYEKSAKGYLDERLLDRIIDNIYKNLSPFINKVEELMDKYDDVDDEKGELDDVINGDMILGSQFFEPRRFEDAGGLRLWDDLFAASTPEAKIIALDQFINFAHDTIDYGENWIEGGRAFLDELSNNRKIISYLFIKDKIQKEAEAKPMDKKAMYEKLANGSWRYIKNIVQDEDERGKLKELLSLRDLIDNEIKDQEIFNEQNGLEKTHLIDYDRKHRINNTLFEILDRYEGSIKNHFNPQPAEAMLNRVLRNIKAKTDDVKQPDEEMMVEKEKDETVPGERKKTIHKKPGDKQLNKDNVFNTSISSPSGETGTREMNDVTNKEPNETQFTR